MIPIFRGVETGTQNGEVACPERPAPEGSRLEPKRCDSEAMLWPGGSCVFCRLT